MTFVPDLVRHDQMVLGVDGGLHVVAHDPRAAAAGGHRARIGIAQRYLTIRRGRELAADRLELLHLRRTVASFSLRCSARPQAPETDPVCAIEVGEVACDALIELLLTGLELVLA